MATYGIEGAASKNPLRENTILEALNSGIIETSDGIYGLAQRLHTLADRIIGQTPAAAGQAGKQEPPPCALITQFERTATGLNAARCFLQDAVERLERL